MRLAPFFGYFGSKFRAAGLYPAPTRGLIVEPFAGAAGYSCRYPDREVLLNDADENIVAIWRYLTSVSETEILSLPDLQLGQSADDLPVCWEAKLLIGFWLQTSAATRKTLWSSRYKSRLQTPKFDKNRTLSFWSAGVRERIASQLRHIRHWKVSLGHYEDLPLCDATWFCDPPYQVAGKAYRKSQIDYERLSAWCQSLPGQVIVCENAGAEWLPFKQLYKMRAANLSKVHGREPRNEVLWTRDET